MSLAWNRLRFAVHLLVAPSSPRERLVDCYTSHLADLRPKDIPLEIRKDFSSLVMRLNRGHGRGPENVKETVESISDLDVMLIIHSIVDMYDAVTRYQPLLESGEYSSQKFTPPYAWHGGEQRPS